MQRTKNVGELQEISKGIRRHIIQMIGAAGSGHPGGSLSATEIVVTLFWDAMQHDPSNPHERRFLHGAACHGCLLISETSCEQQNDFLDRSLVVPTVQGLGAELFSEILANDGSRAVTFPD